MTTHFGYQTVSENQKKSKVGEVFHSVAARYDLMNDLMSLGLHRLWKARFIREIAARPDMQILDVAGGTGDITLALSRAVHKKIKIWLTDINYSMLAIGRDRLINSGICVPTVQCDAQNLPFPTDYFDRVIVSFGLRNMTSLPCALKEMYRVLRPGGSLFVLEFSHIHRFLAPAYDIFSFSVVPRLGKYIAQDEASYRYLVESIRMHPNQEALKHLFESTGFDRVRYINLSAGIVSIHRGLKS